MVETLGNGGTEKRFPLLNFPDRPAHLVGGGLFEQKSHGAGVGGVFDICVIAVRGENKHFGGGKLFEHLAGGFQAVEQGHRDVHQHHGRTKFFDHGERDRGAPPPAAVYHDTAWHGYYAGWGGTLYFAITKFSIEQSDGATATSNDLQRDTVSTFSIAEEIRVIHNFVNCDT